MLEKGLLTRTYSARDQVPDCPDFTRTKNKLPSWDKNYKPRHTVIWEKFLEELEQKKKTSELLVFAYRNILGSILRIVTTFKQGAIYRQKTM